MELARRMLEGEIDPHLESGTFSGENVAEQILWSGASGCSAEIVRMALQRIEWPRDDPRWFWMLWRPLPGHQDLNEAEQADSRATFRLILVGRTAAPCGDCLDPAPARSQPITAAGRRVVGSVRVAWHGGRRLGHADSA